MLTTPTTDLLRVARRALRRADRHLARGAARNAAAGLAAREARRLDDARTLRDLSRVVPADDDEAEAEEGR